jgi:hypothetical protein
MEETIEILKQQAAGYMIMAKALKTQKINPKHYLEAAKACCEEAAKLQQKLNEIEEMMAA